MTWMEYMWNLSNIEVMLRYGSYSASWCVLYVQYLANTADHSKIGFVRCIYWMWLIKPEKWIIYCSENTCSALGNIFTKGYHGDVSPSGIHVSCLITCLFLCLIEAIKSFSWMTVCADMESEFTLGSFSHAPFHLIFPAQSHSPSCPQSSLSQRPPLLAVSNF